MARSTYISENLTQNQIKLMLLLDEYELDIFTLNELKNIAANQFDDVNELVENLVHKNILSRIERGKYCRSNFRDEKVIGTHLVDDGAIAYWSALNYHGLTEQFPNSVFIQTTKVKSSKEVFGVHYNFIKITPRKQKGYIKEGYGNHGFKITDIEKTIVDCFDLPQHSGGYAELIRAFDIMTLSSTKMIEYSQSINNRAAIKRMGFICELLNKKGMKTFVRFAKGFVNHTYNLFDPLGPIRGKHDAEWRLRLNISKSDIHGITNKLY